MLPDKRTMEPVQHSQARVVQLLAGWSRVVSKGLDIGGLVERDINSPGISFLTSKSHGFVEHEIPIELFPYEGVLCDIQRMVAWELLKSRQQPYL